MQVADIGEGSFAKVTHCKLRVSDRELDCAVKLLKPELFSDIKEVVMFIKEGVTLKEIHHPCAFTPTLFLSHNFQATCARCLPWYDANASVILYPHICLCSWLLIPDHTMLPSHADLGHSKMLNEISIELINAVCWYPGHRFAHIRADIF